MPICCCAQEFHECQQQRQVQRHNDNDKETVETPKRTSRGGAHLWKLLSASSDQVVAVASPSQTALLCVDILMEGTRNEHKKGNNN